MQGWHYQGCRDVSVNYFRGAPSFLSLPAYRTTYSVSNSMVASFLHALQVISNAFRDATATPPALQPKPKPFGLSG